MSRTAIVAPPGRLWVAITLASLAVGVAQGLDPLRAVDGLIDATGHMIGRDFVNVWTAGRLVLEGRIDVLPDLSAYQAAQRALVGERLAQHTWSYPPVFLPVTALFGALDYLTALALWSCGTLALMLWACRRAGLGGEWLFLVAVSPATLTNLWFGQNGFLSAALLVGGLAALPARPLLAGALFGLLAYKPHLGLLLPVALFAVGAWRAMAAAAASGTVLVLASVVLFGLQPWIDWLGKIAPFQRVLLERGEGLYTFMMPTAFMAGRMLGLPLTACWAAAAAAAAIAVGVVWQMFRAGCGASDGGLEGRHLRHAGLLVCTVLISPYALNYDLTLVAVAVALAARYQAANPISPWLMLAWALPTALPLFNAFGLPIGPLVLAAAALTLALRHQALIRQHAEAAADPRSAMSQAAG